MKGIKGAATLEPPSGNQPALQSVASMAVLDVVSEGPIYGLTNSDGKKANNISVLESLYLDDTPVLARNLANPRVDKITFNKIIGPDNTSATTNEDRPGLIHRCTSGHMRTAFQNIRKELQSAAPKNVHNPYMSRTKIAELDAESGLFCKFIAENPVMGNFGFIQYKLDGIFNTGNSTAGRLYSRAMESTGAVSSYNLTCFELDTYLGGADGTEYPHLYSRSVRNSKGEVVNIPSPIHYGYQMFDDDEVDYSTSPGMIDVGEGKVGKKFLVNGFAGGGIVFFYIGNNEAEDNDGNFNTGKFFINSATNNASTLRSYDILYNSTSLSQRLQSGIDNGYDVFLHHGDGGVISLDLPAPNQIDPPIGHCAGKALALGFTSDIDLTYNYGNIDFDFRNGFELQPKMEGHSEGSTDFDIRKKLFGPLQYSARTAADGAGEGYADLRGTDGAEVDFSDWMLNPPLESDPFPYTHTIKRIDVKKCTPTIAIEGLSDVIATGDDAGTQKAETLNVSYTIGFEGGVTGSSLSEMLSAGNSIQSIALGQFQSSEIITYSGIVTSNYLDTFSGIDDLPKNSDLKNLVYSDGGTNGIQGLTTALINQYGYTAGDKIFPGDEWKTPNRFIKIQKESFETDSTLISRECSLQYVTETIGEPFSYPLAALGGTIFDARNFAQQPSRSFEIRGKLVSIPSNYNPLNSDGKDKRFIENSSNYGKRSIYRFAPHRTPSSDATTAQKQDSDRSQALVFNNILLGNDNFQIKGKVQFGDIYEGTFHGGQYILDTRPSTTRANRIAIFQTDDKIKLLVRDSVNTAAKECFVSISAHPDTSNGGTTDPVFEFDVLRVGRKFTLTVRRIYTTRVLGVNTSSRIGTASMTMDADVYIEFKHVARQLIFGARADSNPYDSSRQDGDRRRAGLSGNTQIADIQIFKNNNLIHHWDGTIIRVQRHNRAFNEKINGFHASVTNLDQDQATYNSTQPELDANFKFGRNKVNIYNGLWD